MLVYRNLNGVLEMGPNLVRLRHRFAVPNGVAESSADNLKARMMSYLSMMGV